MLSAAIRDRLQRLSGLHRAGLHRARLRRIGLHRAGPGAGQWLRAVLVLAPILVLAGCGQPGGYSRYGALPYGIGQSPSLAPQHYYPPPGPPGDPWGPYIREAAARYQVPEQWVRAVIHQESDGQEQAVSPVGAMGLMQIMPETYAELQAQYGLGDDPYDPHNNILAGTAYIREMYDRYGAPGFLAAYNAGPQRVDDYLAGAADLPNETVNYLAEVTPNLGGAMPMSGPWAVYASAGRHRGYAPSVASLAAGCDLNAAYDPNHPCSSLVRAAVASAPVPPMVVGGAEVAPVGVGGCNLDAAYDPSRPCTSVGGPVEVASAAPQPPEPIEVASAPPQPAPLQQAAANGCNLDAAYDPDHPCASQGQRLAAAAPPPVLRQATPTGCDLDAAYDPGRPCQLAHPAASPTQLAFADSGCDPNAAFDPNRPCHPNSAPAPAWSPPPVAAAPPPRSAPAARYRAMLVAQNRLSDRSAGEPATMTAPGPGAGAHLLAIPTRNWAIQVGAFANPRLARAVAEGARAQAPDQLRSAALALPPTPYGRSVLYRARLAHLSASAASDACWRLNQRQLPCVVVQPSRS
jgi:D-alanyl-D-alanine carboxypeptidase